MRLSIDKIKENKIAYISLAIILIVIMFLLVSKLYSNKITFGNTLEDENKVILDCDLSVSNGKTFTCNISANIIDFTAYSFYAEYSLPSEITFESFTVSDDCVEEKCWSDVYYEEGSNVSISLVNGNGLTGKNVPIGKLTLKMADSQDINSIHTFGLKNILLTNRISEVIMYENVYDVNDDNDLNELDIELLTKYINGTITDPGLVCPSDDSDNICGDIDFNGKIDKDDITKYIDILVNNNEVDYSKQNDINNDLVIDGKDYLLLNKYLINEVGQVELTCPSDMDDNLICGDINNDLVVNENDLIEFAKFFANVSVNAYENSKVLYDDINRDIRIKSNINTINSITVKDITPISSSFEGNNYNLTVDNDINSVVLDYELSDANAKAKGIPEVLSLHYGTNEFNLVVTSEDGVDNTYNIKIKRIYKYNNKNKNFKYYEEDNALYIGKENFDFILGLDLDEEDNVYVNFSDNKLNFLYGEEIVETIDVLSFEVDNTVVDKTIYYESNSLKNFPNKIISNGLKLVVIDTENDVVVSSSDEVSNFFLEDGYKLLVKYKDKVIDTYTFKASKLSFSNSLVIDNDRLIISRIKAGTTYSEFIKLIDTTGNISFKDSKDNEYSEDTYEDNVLKTNDKLVITMEKDVYTYTISVLGDIIGTGDVNINSVSRLYRNIKGTDTKEFTLAEEYAADIIQNGISDINDVSKLYRYIKGTDDKLEVE